MELEKVFEQFNQIKSDIEISIEQLKQDMGEMIHHIVLYGAGSAGIAFLYYLKKAGIHPVCFSDGDPEKWNQFCQGLIILAPDEITSKIGTNALVIVTINTDGKRYCKSFAETLRAGGHSRVHNMLKESGCKHIVDYTFFRRCHQLFKGDLYNLPSCSDVYQMMEHKGEILDVYEYLSDELSKETYRRIVEFRMINDSIEIPTLSQKNQYFEWNLFHKSKEEAFIDCGAYNGITLKTFFENYGKDFNQYMAFEPDEKNFYQINEYVNGLEPELKQKIRLYHQGVWGAKGQAKLYSLAGPGSFLSQIGDKMVPVCTIDEKVKTPVSMIKMNIEGAELQALKGAEQVIKKFHPVLAIAGYHKTWDLWEVPKRIKQYHSGYQIYLRSYMNHISFVYYAVPKERRII